MRKTQSLFIALLALLSVAACDQRRTTDAKICALSDFDPRGALSAGQTSFDVTLMGSTRAKPVKIPNGRWVTPLGKNVRLHPFSMRVAAHPGGRYYAVNNVGLGDFKNGYQSISFIDGETQQPIYFSHPKCNTGEPCDALPVGQIFGDIVFSADGSKLYAAGGGANEIVVINTSAITMPTLAVTSIPVPNFPVGLALLPGGEELLATGFHKHELHRIRLSDGKIVKTYPVQIYPYGVTTDGAFAYVSNLGANSISKVNLASGKVTSMLVGVNPEGVTLSKDGATLYVANSDSDSISVVETASFTTETTRTLDLRDSPLSAPGKSPVDIQISKDGERMYVVLAGDNAVSVFRLPDLTSIGKIPTAWYPTTLVENAAGTQLAVVSAKGFGAGPNDPNQLTEYGITNPYHDIFVGRLQKGQLTMLAVPNDSQLAELSVAVDRNNNVARHLFAAKDGCEQVKGPIPMKVGQPSPIKHVVYIVRENKTYDSHLGDYKGLANAANGDPKLAIWGRSVTPNLHALVEQFGNHDNYYSEPEQSVQGHIWAANGWSNDFSEKVWMGMWANKHDSLFLPAIEHASRGGNNGLIFNVLKAGQDVRIYGEITGTLDHATGSLRDKFNWKYPAWSLHIRDREKAKIFIDDLNKGIFPNFVYIWLPNNHTSGCAEGRPYPVSEIADNDEGTGMIVDAISKSRYWKDTAIFIFEDDPQSTPDHVDAHRSTLVVASPYAKRGWTSHVQLSYPSIHRTMGLMLGVPATSRYEELATPLYDAFQEEPDLTPYNYLPLSDKDYQIASKETLNQKLTVAGVEYFDCQEQGAKFLTPTSLDIEDQMPGLGRIQWYHAKGKSPYPEALVADEDDK